MEFFTFNDDYVRRLRARDPFTEEHFVAYMQAFLSLQLRKYLRRSDALSDVIQETLLRAFTKIRAEGLEDGRKLGSFTAGIARNVVHEYLRKQDRREEPLDEGRHDHPSEDDPFIQFATAETKMRVRMILAELEPRDRQLLEAALLEDADRDEICRSLGIDRDYLRVRLHRAKERFREQSAGGVEALFRRR